MKKIILSFGIIAVLFLSSCGSYSSASTPAASPLAGTWLVTDYLDPTKAVDTPVAANTAMMAYYAQDGSWSWVFPAGIKIFQVAGTVIPLVCDFGGTSTVNGTVFTGTITFNSCPASSNLGGPAGTVMTQNYTVTGTTLTLVLNDGPLAKYSIIFAKH
jgi:hypothetical protein